MTTDFRGRGCRIARLADAIIRMLRGGGGDIPTPGWGGSENSIRLGLIKHKVIVKTTVLTPPRYIGHTAWPPGEGQGQTSPCFALAN
jgi:hypothetical protein